MAAPARRARGRGAAIGLALASLLLAGCSVRRLAINSVAKTLTGSGEVFASDDDPELIREALPFALKTLESLLAEAPSHRGLLLSACSGFTSYAYAFVETDAELLELEDYARARSLQQRALNLYLRAREYGLRALELEVPGVRQRLATEPAAALASFGGGTVETLYWTGAAWGAAISLGQDRPEIVVDLPAVRALMERVLEIDERFDRGSAHEAMMVLEALPEYMGGSRERARQHFERALELSGGVKASPYVTFAEAVVVATQDRAEFERLLGEALEIDPDAEPGLRLANLIAQRRARHLRDHADDLFLGE